MHLISECSFLEKVPYCGGYIMMFYSSLLEIEHNLAGSAYYPKNSYHSIVFGTTVEDRVLWFTRVLWGEVPTRICLTIMPGNSNDIVLY